MNAEDLIKITEMVDNILHDNGFQVDHNILASHIFRAIKESYDIYYDIYPAEVVDMLGSTVLELSLSLKPLPEIV